MFSDGDDVGSSNFSNGDLSCVGSVQINVIRSNSSSDTDLEVLGLGDDFSGSVSWVEWSGDENTVKHGYKYRFH